MMQTKEITMVRKIEWFSNDADMILTCEIMSGAFKYTSNIALSGESLNKVLSDLQKQQPSIDLNECMKIEQWSQDEVSYVFDFSALPESELQFHRPKELYNFRQIRA